MTPRLIAVSGPLKGSVFPLGDGGVTLGRLESNAIAVPDMAVSRRHCIIRSEGAAFKLIDLKSRNGSYVNTIPVKEHELREGDRVGIGDSHFIFRISEDQRTPTWSVEVKEEPVAGNTVQLRREDAVYLQPDRLLPAGSPTPRQTRDLQALLRVSQAINSGSAGDLQGLAQRLLALMLELVQADRGVILLGSEANGDLESAAALDRRAGSNVRMQVSRTLVRRVLDERVAVLCNDIRQDEMLGKAESVVASLVHAVLAVPIPGREKPSGVIYLAILTPSRRFEEADLHLVTGIGGVSAAAFESALHLANLENENQRLQGEIEVEHRMVGNSPVMEDVYRFVGRAARQGSTVLITGESGTGKELVARALHANSPRASKPFVAVNCAALVESLLESELFGHEKGAFTGAAATKKGKIEVADGGTLFLDEIAEMAPKLQAKLLRVLQEREFERVGGTRPLKVDIRVVAATNRELEQEIQRGNFRQDLFYRLNVVAVRVPPLRERREDISPLANYFVNKYCREANHHTKVITPETLACMVRYDWPGNVRELQNAIEHAVVLGSGDTILPEELPDAVLESATSTAGLASYHEAVRQAKREVILKAFEKAGGNYTGTAKALGIHVNYLHRVIRTLGLKPALRQPGGNVATGA
jgi:transcriptional regulator with GAF, ATPase, and Fis domain